MHYIVESSKSFYEATFDLVPTIQRLGFVVLATHDLGGLLQRKDIDLDDDCQIVEICNYRYVEKLLAIDMRFSVSLPGGFQSLPKTVPPKSASVGWIHGWQPRATTPNWRASSPKSSPNWS